MIRAAALLLIFAVAGCSAPVGRLGTRATARPEVPSPTEAPLASPGSPPAAPSPSPSACVTPYRDPKAARAARGKLVADLRKLVERRPGRVSVMARDLRTGATVGYKQDFDQQITASGAKVDILVTLLMRARAAGRKLGEGERDTAERMIMHSDNNAADALYRRIGGGAGVAATYRKLGMKHTSPGPGPYWGGTTTSPADRVRLMTALVKGAKGLHPDDRRYALGLMERVEPGQKWGVSAAAAKGDSVALKNGWTPRPFIHNTWAVTSYGRVHGTKHDWVISVQSDVQPGMGSGITTIEQVSSLVSRGLPLLDPIRYRSCGSNAH